MQNRIKRIELDNIDKCRDKKKLKQIEYDTKVLSQQWHHCFTTPNHFEVLRTSVAGSVPIERLGERGGKKQSEILISGTEKKKSDDKQSFVFFWSCNKHDIKLTTPFYTPSQPLFQQTE